MDMGVLERFVEDNADRAYSYALGLCRNEPDARELTQAAFVRFLDKADPESDPAEMKCWLFTVVRNLYYDLERGWERKRGTPVQTVIGADGMTLADALPDAREEALLEALERREDLDRLRAAFLALPDDFREILGLVDLGGVGYEDAARTLGLPLGTVRSRVSRARGLLRDRMLSEETKR